MLPLISLLLVLGLSACALWLLPTLVLVGGAIGTVGSGAGAGIGDGGGSGGRVVSVGSPIGRSAPACPSSAPSLVLIMSAISSSLYPLSLKMLAYSSEE